MKRGEMFTMDGVYYGYMPDCPSTTCGIEEINEPLPEPVICCDVLKKIRALSFLSDDRKGLEVIVKESWGDAERMDFKYCPGCGKRIKVK